MLKIIPLLVIPIFLFSCASTHPFMRGTVAMKMSEKSAHVCMGDNEVKKGDRITFFENQCGAREIEIDEVDVLRCELVKIGEGEIVNTLNSHYSLVKTDGSFKFKEGTLVQKSELK